MINKSYITLPFTILTSLSRVNVLCILIFCICVFPNNAFSETLLKEDKIKASYVFNFIRFINWPKDAFTSKTEPVNVCVMERNEAFIKAFQPVVGKKVNGHPLSLKKLSSPESSTDCHVVYIDKSEKKNIDQLLISIERSKTLTISDIKAFCKQGGMICMVNQKGKIRVDINLDVAREAGFQISSNLLEVANIVTSQ